MATTQDFRAVLPRAQPIPPADGVGRQDQAVESRGTEKFAQSESRAKADNFAETDDAKRLGPWILESLRSEGMLTQVHRARPADAPNRLSARYAIKLLRDQWHDYPSALLRLRREWQVGRAVAHRHVISMLSAHVHRPPYYLVMPWIDGIDVASRLLARGRIRTPVALWIARQAAEALEALHTTGYLHGDVKPANLLVDRLGHVTLIDLGCARRFPDEPTLDDPSLSGTPSYLAPETFVGRPSDRRSDLYSLGITLWEMLAGRLPTMGEDLAAVANFKRQGVLPSVRVFAPQVPSEVSDLIRRLTAREPLRRPQTAREVVQELLRLEIATLRERVSR